MMHPLQWPDLIVAILLAEGLLFALRESFHFVSRKRSNQRIAQRIEQMRPGTLDNYRYTVKGEGHAPLG